MAAEPRIVANGEGWRVYRQGRQACVSIALTELEGTAEIWVNSRASDCVRSALLGALASGAYGAVPERAAIEAMQADW